MGGCASTHSQKRPRKEPAPPRMPTVAKVILQDGRVKELKPPVTAGQALGAAMAEEEGAGSYYLCSWESMFVDERAPDVPEEEELNAGQVYFVMQRSNCQTPLSLEEMCELAVKASSCLSLDEFHLSLL